MNKIRNVGARMKGKKIKGCGSGRDNKYGSVVKKDGGENKNRWGDGYKKENNESKCYGEDKKGKGKKKKPITKYFIENFHAS